MARDFRSRRPPRTEDESLNRHLDQVSDALNKIPAFSQISTTDGPESTETADAGTLAFDTGSSATTFWGKQSGDTSSGWEAFDLRDSTPREWLAYGSLKHDSRATQNGLTSSGETYTLWTTAGNALHMTPDTADSGITSDRSGWFNFSFEASAIDDRATDSGSTVSFNLRKNTVASKHSVAAITNEPGTISMSASDITAQHDDQFAIYISAISGDPAVNGDDDIGVGSAEWRMWLEQ